MDTGASNHVCAHDTVAETKINGTMSNAVETANGTVHSLGVAKVGVEKLGENFDMTVLNHCPDLLSVGRLVDAGYKFHWDETGCYLIKPSDEMIELEVNNYVPVLYDDSASNRYLGNIVVPLSISHGNGLAAPVDVERGIESMHRQVGHFPFDPRCRICVESSVRSKMHKRKLIPRIDCLHVDIASMSMGGPYVMIGVRQFPSSVFVEQIDSKKISSIRVALLRMISIAKETGDVGVIFSDRESSICAVEQDILLTGARLETTQGGDPASNGVAEQMVQKLCDMSRSVLASYPVHVRKQLWSSAMIWSGQKVRDTNIPPLG